MNTPASAEHRAHNQSPEGILPVLPPHIAAEEMRESILEARAAAKEASGEGAPAFDAGKIALYSANVAAFCDACGAWKDLGRIETTEQSERLTDFVAGARGLGKKIEDARKAEKKVHDDRGKEVQKAYTPLLDKLDRVLVLMKGMQGDWLRREDARIAAEKAEAARIAREEAEAAERALAAAEARNDVSGLVDAEAALEEANKAQTEAAKPVKASAGSATGGGRTMSLRNVYTAEFTNFRAAFVAFENEPEIREVMQRLANAKVRAADYVEGSIPGITRKTSQVAA